MATAILVIDMLRGFLEPGNPLFCGEASRHIIPTVRRLLARDVERIRQFREASATIMAFGVGHYISGAPPIDFTADLHEIDGMPIAKRGRIPGRTPNPRLRRVI